MKQLSLVGIPTHPLQYQMAETRSHSQEPRIDGWLYKWTNYLKGYQKRWFVLSNGLLSYYRNRAEMSHTCRGTISLVSAVIHTEDSCNFVVSNGGTQTFHLKAQSEIERQKWVTALELGKARAIRTQDSEDDEDYAQGAKSMDLERQEVHTMLKPLITKHEELRTCHDLIIKHGSALQHFLTELEQIENPAEAVSRCKTVNERATLFRITSNAMINSSAEYLSMASVYNKKWTKLLQHEHENRLRLEEMVEQLAKQHSHLELRAIQQSGQANSPAIQPSQTTSASAQPTSGSEEDEFYDAEEAATEFYVAFPGIAHRIGAGSGKGPHKSKNKEEQVKKQESVGDDASSGSDGELTEGDSMERAGVVITRSKGKKTLKDTKSFSSTSSELPLTGRVSESDDSEEQKSKASNRRQRRASIPFRPNHSVNLWSIMKNCIGKELTKIPMPVNFNEPLSMLQRVTEDFEYADLLHKAAKVSKNSADQMIYVAAFAVSTYSSTSCRTGKPFNPLLGETYEADRSEDLGWRSLAEQVSHHPPILAIHCEAARWTCWSEYAMASKFRGKYLQIQPLDMTHLIMKDTNHHYTWKRVTTTVHNIIVGRLWVDHQGDMIITNHTTGDECHLKFIPYSYFSRDVPRKVTGVVINDDGIAQWVIQGSWDNKLEASRVVNSRSSSKSKPILETSTPRIIWKRMPSPENSDKMYNFSKLAIELNEPEPGVAPTDSRLRPDQRLMEQGEWDESNRVKGLLEDKQRTVRRRREAEAEEAARAGRPLAPHAPLWFKKDADPITGNPIHVYHKDYWSAKEKQDWSSCPDIFLSPDELKSIQPIDKQSLD